MRPSHPPPIILNAWRTRIRTHTPQTVCYWAVSLELKQRVLPAFGGAQDDCQSFARVLARPLVDAALAKLARRFRKDARKGQAHLIRWHVDEAYRVCGQGVEWVAELLLEDRASNPRDPLSKRISRVYAVVSKAPMPSWKGRRGTGVGRAYNLALLVRYERWLATLAAAFPARDWIDAEPSERERVLAAFVPTLEPEEHPPGPWPLRPELHRAACACPRREIAARIIVAGTASLTRLTPRSLKDLLRKTRPLARRLGA